MSIGLIVVAATASGPKILANLVHAQLSEHMPYGGVVPEIAARAHLDHLDPLISRALAEAGVGLGDIDGIAAATGPGLIGGLIVGSMTNFGVPYIQVEDGDHRKARELYLRHVFEGREIDIRYAERVLRYLHTLWGRPVHLQTVLDDLPCVLSFDGHENTRRSGVAGGS